MKKIFIQAMIALALLATATGPAFAQTRTPIVLGSDGKPKDSVAVVCPSLSGVLAACATGSGGGGAGDASAANQATQITAANLTNTNLGGVTETAPASDTASSGLNGRLQRIAQRLTTLLGSLGTSGATAPASTLQVGGQSGSTGNLMALRVGPDGGLIGGGMVPTSGTPTALTASTSTALVGGGSTTRPSYLKVTVETTLAAPLYLCLTNQTCSATVHDEMIPTGATAGTRLFVEIPFTTAVTYFTTGTPTVTATRWAN